MKKGQLKDVTVIPIKKRPKKEFDDSSATIHFLVENGLPHRGIREVFIKKAS